MTHRAGLASLLVAVLLSGVAVPAYAELCVVDLVLLNRHRRVAGPVSAECDNPLIPNFLEHSPPFGNWGVAFNHAAVDETRDGYQFSGWKAMGGWLQWNSCTTDDQFRSPDPRYYNDNGFQTQRASPNIVNVSHSLEGFAAGPRGVSCAKAFPKKSVDIGNVQMDVYELDPGPGDRRVATLSYGQVVVRYDCSDAWLCYGESDWIEPLSDTHENVYAQLRIVVQLRKRANPRGSWVVESAR